MASRGHSSYDHDQDTSYGSRTSRPCRACTDFTSWMQQTGKSVTHAGKTNSDQQDQHGKQCPVDKDQLGRRTWSLLHTMAAYYPKKPSEQQQKDMKEFIRTFSLFYPCDICAADLRKDMASDPPETHSQPALSQWWCRIHNKVNSKLGKPTFDCSLVDQRWLDGWSDGSCG